MGRKLDLTGLTDSEATHVLQVVQRDMKLRKKEEERLSELKQELDEEGSRCLLLSRQTCFNRRCCIRCCSPFSFLLNPKRKCKNCSYNVCKACRVYNQRDKVWLCSACQKSRLLKAQSIEWFYSNVKKRFKRFGSAKVLKTLYRKHLAEHNALSELTEGSACDDSVCNEDSICGSDSAFYKQTEEHSMAEMLSVAMRVAEEAVDEAISKAEVDASSEEKQDEVYYLREHRAELVEELAKTIVQKIISRRKTLAEIKAHYDREWLLERDPDPNQRQQPPSEQASSSLTHQPNLWHLSKSDACSQRSHSAFTLLDDDQPILIQESPRSLKKEVASSPVTTWKSVDRLDSSSMSSVLKSPDGNWIALQSAQLPRPGLLTKRKSLVYSALEKESGVKSAYEELGSDDETRPEPDNSWGAAMQEIHRKMTDANFHLHASPGDGDHPFPDSDGNWKLSRPLQALLKKKVPAEIRKPSSSRRTSVIDINFNQQSTEGEEEEEKEIKRSSESEGGEPRKSEKKRKKGKKRRGTDAASYASFLDFGPKDSSSLPPSDVATPGSITSETPSPEPSDLENVTGGETNHNNDLLQQKEDGGSDTCSAEDEPVSKSEGDCERVRGLEEDEGAGEMEFDSGGERPEDEDEIKSRLYRLVAQSRLSYFSSTDEELEREPSEEDWSGRDDIHRAEREGEEKERARFTDRLCSSEDEDGEENRVDEEEGGREHLSIKVCRLVNQIHAAQFSSTEDELDRAGMDEEDETDEGALWDQPEKARLRDLASLVSASQFSSTEDELDKVGEGISNSTEEVEERLWEGTESMGDLDMKMFNLKGEADEGETRDERGVPERLGELFKGSRRRDGHPEAQREVEKLKEKKQRAQKSESSKTESKESPAAWASEAESEEDETELERIISSMLMLTLEDMQAGEKREVLQMKEDVIAQGSEEKRVKLDETAASRNGNHQTEGATLEQCSDMSIKVSDVDEAPCSEGGVCVKEKQEETEEGTPRYHGKSKESTKEVFLSPQEVREKHSAASLRGVTTEILKVLNATEDLLQEVDGADCARAPALSLAPDTDPRQLDREFSKLEENVYVAAGAAFSLEEELGELEECARGISSSTSDLELAYLEEHVAATAAKVQQSELQVCDISSRIAALKNAGLNVGPQSRLCKVKPASDRAVTLNSSRQQRRRLPVPPTQGAPAL